MPEITIRRMTMDDVDGVYAVEIGTFVDAWSRDAFVSDMKNPVARYLVAEQDGKIIGYAGAWVILDESHITNIAVLKEHRGQGTGKRLTHGLLQYISNLGAAYATLEVRRSFFNTHFGYSGFDSFRHTAQAFNFLNMFPSLVSQFVS